MSVHMPACPHPRMTPWRRRLARLAIALALAATLAACGGGRPPPYAGADPSDPAAPVRAVAAPSTVGPYTRQRPVEPAPWQQQNERVAPAPEGAR